jgi:hypothetical protein
MSSSDKECPKPDLSDPTIGQNQIYVQVVLSLALGASAFFCFCVSLVANNFNYGSILTCIDPPPKMEESLWCPKKTVRRCGVTA